MRTTASMMTGRRSGAMTTVSPEMSLLGTLGPECGRARVRKANLQSSMVHPADLDAFLRGYFKAC